MQAYLSNVFLIDEIYVVGEKQDQIRVRTVLAGSTTNLFAQVRLNFVDKNTVRREYTFPISECSYAENNNDEDMIMRLQLGKQKFFAHRRRQIYSQPELVEAILHPDVHRIKTGV